MPCLYTQPVQRNCSFPIIQSMCQKVDTKRRLDKSHHCREKRYKNDKCMYCNMDIEGSKSPYIKVEKERKAQFHKITSGTRRKFNYIVPYGMCALYSFEEILFD